MRGISFVVAPIRDHAFFEQTVLQRQIGNRLFQGTGLTAQLLNFTGRRSTSRVASQPPFAGFQEFLRPGVVEALGYPFLAARSAMLSSPRSPSSTIRILSSDEKCRRVARRISLTTCSAERLPPVDFVFMFVPSSATRTEPSLDHTINSVP